jgi:hypothetical protein
MEPALLAMLAAAVLVLGVATALGRALARSSAGQRRLELDLAATRAELATLRDRLEQVDARSAPPAAERPDADRPDYVITTLADASAPEPVREPTHEGGPSRREFASVAVTESVVKLAALAHGVRRALSPQSRNRIRFEMGREVKRARRERRSAAKQFRRRREPDPTVPDLATHRADEAA